MTSPRATTTAGFLDLVDVLSRGGTAEWRALYRRAMADVELRTEIEAALVLTDPELGAARELWAYLLTTLPER
jgi:hypothetical protein